MFAPPDGFLTLHPLADPVTAQLRRKVVLLAARALLTDALPTDRGRRAAALRLRQGLQELLTASAPATLRALGRPDVLPALLCLTAGTLPPDACWEIGAPNLLAALHREGASPASALLWPGPVPRLSGSCWGVVAPERPLRGVALDRSGLSVEDADGRIVDLGGTPPAQGPSERALSRPALHLALADSNPLSELEAHPDKVGNALDLGGRADGEWVAALNEALDLIAVSLPGWLAGLPDAVTRFVPVGAQRERHLSASYREAPGIAYLSLHPDPLTMAEAIVHEAQHSRLNLLMWLDPVLVNGQTEWTTSPVRPDLRPLSGVLLAAHAFVPVAAMHRALALQRHPASLTPTFTRRRTQVLETNRESLRILEARGRPTTHGRRVIDALQQLSRWAEADGGTTA